MTAKEIRTTSPSEKLRGRRASSLAKDVLMSSVIMDEDLELESGSAGLDGQPSARRARRCTSVAKEMLRVEMKDSDSESVQDELPVRRSTRLASFARKELQADGSAERSFARSGSVTSLTKLTSDDEEGENAHKRSLRRTRKSSVSSDKDDATTNRSLRSSARDLDKERSSKELDIKMTRKRGSSAPKEITAQSVGSRRRRSSSIIKEIIPEVAESPEESRRSENSAARNMEQIGKLTTNVRVRSTSILSIPEELEEILSPPLRKTRSTRRKAVQSNARERRAASADVIHTEMKRRVRNVDATSVAVEPIAEELVESEDGVKLERDVKTDSKAVQNVPASKRRAASTTVKETKKDTMKPRRGRPRKTSVSHESSNLFSFSLPEKTDDVPLDEKGNSRDRPLAK